ncbi:hypothetical protein Bbelb_344690 [Branchiostoma belcheri]|nr:hypothetical protein Bbelb_344690 [Branchiostoma belcheri]
MSHLEYELVGRSVCRIYSSICRYKARDGPPGSPRHHTTQMAFYSDCHKMMNVVKALSRNLRDDSAILWTGGMPLIAEIGRCPGNGRLERRFVEASTVYSNGIRGLIGHNLDEKHAGPRFNQPLPFLRRFHHPSVREHSSQKGKGQDGVKEQYGDVGRSLRLGVLVRLARCSRHPIAEYVAVTTGLSGEMPSSPPEAPVTPTAQRIS